MTISCCLRFSLAGLFAICVLAASAGEVRIESRNAPGVLPAGSLVLQATDPQAPAQTFPLGGNGVVVAPEGGGEVTLNAPGWWSPKVSLTPGVVILPAWRTGKVRGRVAVQSGALPKEIRLVVESPPDPERPPEIARGTQFHCPVLADGTWECALPATILDIAVRGDGFTPHYRWGTTVTTARNTELGTIVLKKGASVLAWLDRQSNQGLRTPARAALMRMIVPGQPSAASARLSSPVAEATFNKVGAVQLVGVPAGVYMLVVSAGGFADARAHPIEVDESRETILRRAVRLERPVTARVGVAPAVDPHGAPWRVSLKRRSDFTAGFDPLPDAAARTNTLGVAEIAGRNPGRYALVVEDSRGNDLFFDDWSIGHESAAERLIDLPLKEVRGTVTLDEEPVAAAVSFGGTHGVVRVEMTAGADGKFRGYLPRGGRWRVAVRNAGTRNSTLLDVDVEEDGDVAIELPNTSVSGIVLDSRGNAVERARVTLLVPETALTARTDPAGRFTFDSVPLGRRTMSAVHADGSEASAQVELEVTAEMPAHDGIELKLLPKRTIAGRVMSRGVPVIGARVRARAVDVRGAAGTGISDTDGRFRIDLREDARRVNVTVAAAGFALQAFELDTSGGPPLLELARQGGTLLLDLPESASALELTLDGIWISAADLAGWTAALGHEQRDARGRRQIPQLAPGSIRVCVVAAGESRQRCRDGQLAPQGSLQLDLTR